MASGEYNRKHNKKIHRPCPVCGSRVIVANHGEIWWVACDADRTHIKQVYFHEPIDAIRWWNARTNADKIRAMSDEELAKFLLEFEYHESNLYCMKLNSCTWDDPCADCLREWLKKEVE